MGNTTSAQSSNVTRLFLLGDTFLYTVLTNLLPFRDLGTIPQTRACTLDPKRETVMASNIMGVKETRPEKAGVSQRACEQGICVSQSTHLAFGAKSSLTLSLSQTGATRLKGIPEAGKNHSRTLPGSPVVLFHPAKPSQLHLYPRGIRPSITHVYQRVKKPRRNRKRNKTNLSETAVWQRQISQSGVTGEPLIPLELASMTFNKYLRLTRCQPLDSHWHPCLAVTETDKRCFTLLLSLI